MQLSKLFAAAPSAQVLGAGQRGWGGEPAGPTGRGSLEISRRYRSGDSTDSEQPGTEFLAPGCFPDPQGQWGESPPCCTPQGQRGESTPLLHIRCPPSSLLLFQTPRHPRQ